MAQNELIRITPEASEVLDKLVRAEIARGKRPHGLKINIVSDAIINLRSSTGSSSQPTSNPIPAPGSQSQTKE